jgi:hypothetical protein
LDTLVWQDLCRVLTEPALITHELARAQGGEWLPHALQARRHTLRKALAEVERQQARLLEVYLAAIIGREEFDRKHQELTQTQHGLAQQLRQLELQAQQQIDVAALAQGIEAFCHRIGPTLDHLTFAQRRQLVTLLIDRVIVSDGQVEIRYVVPTGPQGETVPFCHLRLDYFYGEAARIGKDHLHGSKGEVGTEQIPRGEGQPRGGDDHYAGGQSARGPDAAQEDGSLPDHDGAVTTPYAPGGLVLTQALRKASEPLLDPAGLATQTRPPRAQRAPARRKGDARVTAPAPQGKLLLGTERAQPRATQNPAVGQPEVPDARRQAQRLGQGTDRGRDRAPFDVEHRADQDTRPLPPFCVSDSIAMSGEDITVPLEVFGASGDGLKARKPVDRGEVLGVGFLGVGGRPQSRTAARAGPANSERPGRGQHGLFALLPTIHTDQKTRELQLYQHFGYTMTG